MSWTWLVNLLQSIHVGDTGSSPASRGEKSTWKPYLSKSTDTLPWKLLHYKLQVTNSKTTWVKVLEYLILTVLKYFTYTKYSFKETCQWKTVTLWRSWGNRQRQGSMCRHFMEKLEQTISQKPKGTKNRMMGKQTTITFNNSQRTKETLGLYIQYTVNIHYFLNT